MDGFPNLLREIPDICQVWYTITVLRPVKKGTKKCVNLWKLASSGGSDWY